MIVLSHFAMPPPFWSVVDSPPAMTADFIAEPSGSDNHRYTGPAAERPLFTVIVPLLNEERWKLKRGRSWS